MDGDDFLELVGASVDVRGQAPEPVRGVDKRARPLTAA